MTEQTMVAINNTAICLCIAACTFATAYWLHSSDGLWSVWLMICMKGTSSR
jgi:hypothetical protein